MAQIYDPASPTGDDDDECDPQEDGSAGFPVSCEGVVLQNWDASVLSVVDCVSEYSVQCSPGDTNLQYDQEIILKTAVNQNSECTDSDSFLSSSKFIVTDYTSENNQTQYIEESDILTTNELEVCVETNEHLLSPCVEDRTEIISVEAVDKVGDSYSSTKSEDHSFIARELPCGDLGQVLCTNTSFDTDSCESQCHSGTEGSSHSNQCKKEIEPLCNVSLESMQSSPDLEVKYEVSVETSEVNVPFGEGYSTTLQSSDDSNSSSNKKIKSRRGPRVQNENEIETSNSDDVPVRRSSRIRSREEKKEKEERAQAEKERCVSDKNAKEEDGRIKIDPCKPNALPKCADEKKKNEVKEDDKCDQNTQENSRTNSEERRQPVQSLTDRDQLKLIRNGSDGRKKSDSNRNSRTERSKRDSKKRTDEKAREKDSNARSDSRNENSSRERKPRRKRDTDAVKDNKQMLDGPNCETTIEEASCNMLISESHSVVAEAPPPPPPVVSSPRLDLKREDDLLPKPEKVKSRWRRSSELERGEVSGSSTPTDISETADRKSPVLAPVKEVPSIVEKQEKQTDVITKVEQAQEYPGGYEEIEENIYLFERKRSKSKKEVRRMICDCTLTKAERECKVPGCGEDCLNRLLMIECGSRCPTADLCTNKRFQKKLYANTEPFKTEKKGWGLRTKEDLPVGTFVMEYVGEVINPQEFKQRVKQYAREKNNHYYFMALKSDEIIDATAKGNLSRFINHSCNPNCETQKWTVNGELQIGFFTRCYTKVGEELTFDYQFQRYGKEAQKCYCESNNCRGYIGEDKQISLKSYNGNKKRRKTSEDKKRETLEDLAFEEEIEKLCAIGGLRNREHTLMLARLMVRADETDTRQRLLNIIEHTTEQACLRLFLDYHGLSLIWSWMVDIADSASRLKPQLLRVLSLLPIPNKTMLLDSKVMNVVQRWAIQGSGQKSSSERDSENAETEQSSEPPSGATTPCQDGPEMVTLPATDGLELGSPIKRAKPGNHLCNSQSPASSTTVGDEIGKNVSTSCPIAEGAEHVADEALRQTNVPPSDTANADSLLNDIAATYADPLANQNLPDCQGAKKLGVTSTAPKLELLGRSDDESGDTVDEEDDTKESSLVNLASRLLDSWGGLKEVFRIPRLEKQKRREDEREADRREREQNQHRNREKEHLSPQEHYRDRNKDYSPDGDRGYRSRSRDGGRHRGDYDRHDWRCSFGSPESRDDRRYSKSEKWRNFDEEVEVQPRRTLLPTPLKISKEKRRQLFALEVQQRDQEEAIRRQHEEAALISFHPNVPVGFEQQASYSPFYTANPAFVAPVVPTPPVAGQPVPLSTIPVPPIEVMPERGHGPLGIVAHQPALLPTPSYPPGPPPPAVPPPSLMPPMPVPAPQFPGNRQQFLEIGPQYPDNRQQYPDSSQPYPENSQPYPDNNHSYPNNSQPYPDNNQVYPQNSQPYPDNSHVYPNGNQPYPGHNQPYLDHNQPYSNNHLPDNSQPYQDTTQSYPDSSQPCLDSSLPYVDQSQLCPDNNQLYPDKAHAIGFAQGGMYQQTVTAISPDSGVGPFIQPAAIPYVAPPTPPVQPPVQPANPPYIPNQPQQYAPPVGQPLYYIQSAPPPAVVAVQNSPSASSGIIQPPLQPAVHQQVQVLQFAQVHSVIENSPVAPSPPPKAKPVKLPPSWKTAKDPEGNVYYYHSVTRQTQWDPPSWDQEEEDMDLGTPTYDEPKAKKKSTLTAAADTSSEVAKKIKELFRSKMSSFIVQCLNPFRKPDCKMGRITSTEDFKHLARKLTHFVMSKELKHCKNVEDLECNDNVRHKAKDFIQKYMSKYGPMYRKDKAVSPKDDD